MSSLKIKDWSPDDRPREKMITKGAAILTNAELIAILLTSGTRAETVVEMAQRILAMCNNSMSELGRLEYNQMCKIKGIGVAKAATLLAALELGRRRAATDNVQNNLIHSAKDVVDSFRPLLADLQHEEMWVLLLNRANRVMERIKISHGGLNATIMDVRVIIKQAIEKLAIGIIMVHNHPSGNVEPSSSDIYQTKRLKDAAALFEIQLIDHVIVSDGNYYSFAEKGIINRVYVN